MVFLHKVKSYYTHNCKFAVFTELINFHIKNMFM